ncbi:hypothetical protein [Streptomyces sp. UNOC14_S4]|uniref:hypothetical protein n=1 Tax=Streptomyces sp. UNOC14_S4 TaxID=2872340 RepID=UPI001E5866AB|nr:hypothetical protein [Streptomyces sp. UNOC14_S4]MCC3766450.1 hypothetical protein [Streptomyces sp. UNOC14_S4]
MDFFSAAGWGSAGVRWGAELVDEWRDRDEHGDAWVQQKVTRCRGYANQCSLYTKGHRFLTVASALGSFGGFVALFITMLAKPSGDYDEHYNWVEPDLTVHHALVAVIYTVMLVSLPLYIGAAVRTFTRLMQAWNKVELHNQMKESRSGLEYAVRTMSQPVYWMYSTIGRAVMSALPFPQWHTRLYQEAIYRCLYRGINTSDLPGTPWRRSGV